MSLSYFLNKCLRHLLVFFSLYPQYKNVLLSLINEHAFFKKCELKTHFDFFNFPTQILK